MRERTENLDQGKSGKTGHGTWAFGVFSVVLALNLILEYRSDRRLEELYESKYLTTLEKLFAAENELDRIRRLCPEVDAEISGP